MTRIVFFMGLCFSIVFVGCGVDVPGDVIENEGGTTEKVFQLDVSGESPHPFTRMKVEHDQALGSPKLVMIACGSDHAPQKDCQRLQIAYDKKVMANFLQNKQMKKHSMGGLVCMQKDQEEKISWKISSNKHKLLRGLWVSSPSLTNFSKQQLRGKMELSKVGGKVFLSGKFSFQVNFEDYTHETGSVSFRVILTPKMLLMN